MDFYIQPLADRVVKLQDKEERTRSGICLPDTASQEKSQEDRVMAVGDGKLNDEFRRTPTGVKMGHTVLVAKYTGSEIKLDDVDYLILAEKNILAVMTI